MVKATEDTHDLVVAGGTNILRAVWRGVVRRDIHLPRNLPPSFVWQPWCETDPILVSPAKADSGPKIVWAGNERWVEVTFGLLGNAGSVSRHMQRCCLDAKCCLPWVTYLESPGHQCQRSIPLQ